MVIIAPCQVRLPRQFCPFQHILPHIVHLEDFENIYLQVIKIWPRRAFLSRFFSQKFPNDDPWLFFSDT